MGTKFHLISFNAAMREALAAGRKTQTRRLESCWPEGLPLVSGTVECDIYRDMKAKYGPVGSVLVVREDWAAWKCWDDKRPAEIPPLQGWNKEAGRIFYQGGYEPGAGKLRHERFMPYWAGRTLLRVEKIRFQPVGEISGEDAKAEGVQEIAPGRWSAVPGMVFSGGPVRAFSSLWDSIHGAGSFEASDMVWAYTFRAIDSASDEYKGLRAEIMAEAVKKFEGRKAK